MSTPKEIVTKLLSNTLSPSTVRSLVSPTATYISLCYNNPDLKRLMPYAGSHQQEGPEAIIYTFSTVNHIWINEDFQIETLFAEGGNVAVFGRFRYKSRVLGRVYESPFSIHCVVEEGLVTYMQFMEDTFGTGATFEKRGSKTYEVEEGVEVEIGVE